MIELTEQQRQAMQQVGEMPTTFLDPQTRQEYVLLRADVYARLREINEEDDARLMAPLVADLDPEDWQDLSSYEQIMKVRRGDVILGDRREAECR